jgi:ubiquinol-cytochrome c reductase cytochrome b subunit
MDAVAMLGAFMILATLANGVKVPLTDPANPNDVSFTPIPEWYFLFYYQLLKYFHGPWEIVGTLILPLVFFTILLLLPFLDKTPRRDLLSRKGVMVCGALFLLSVFGLLSVSIKQISAVPVTDPAVEQGKRLYGKLGCSGCHRIHGEGAQVGPDLSYVGDSRNTDWFIRHFKNPRAMVPDSIMPAFPLTDTELKQLTAYMLSLKRSRSP